MTMWLPIAVDAPTGRAAARFIASARRSGDWRAELRVVRGRVEVIDPQYGTRIGSLRVAAGSRQLGLPRGMRRLRGRASRLVLLTAFGERLHVAWPPHPAPAPTAGAMDRQRPAQADRAHARRRPDAR